jgi:ABC-type branched-subunit amino acid transport system substrate-binding protein
MAGCRAALLLTSLALVTSACGARVSTGLRREAADAQLGRTPVAGGPAGAASAGSTSARSAPSGNGAAPGAAVGGPGAAGPSGAAGAVTGAGGQSPGAPAPEGGNGGATDVGVAADSIVLGNVSDLSGPVPGVFQGAATGTLAYLNYINSLGGVDGRLLRLDISDSQTSCSQTENAYNSLTGKVFAFVGSFGIYDDCAASVLGQHGDIPAVEYMLSAQGVALRNDFSVDPIPPGGYATGMFDYYGAKFGSAVQHVGSFWTDIPSANAQVTGINAAAASRGWKFAYTRAVGATESNFTADVVRMQSSGVKVVFLVGTTGQNAATFVDEAEQQNWHPIFILPIAYAQNFLQLVGGSSAAEGIYGYDLYSLFFNRSDAQAIPEVALYQHWMQQTSGAQPEDLYSMYGWAEAALFVQALKAAGPRAKRAGVMAALTAVHSFGDNGIVGDADPADKVPTHCYVLWEIHDGQFIRLDSPAAGYRCDGTFWHP